MNIKDFLAPGYDEVVQKAAALLQQVVEQHEAGRLTDAQFQELGHDILVMSHANEGLMEMEQRQRIYSALNKLASVAGIISKIV